MKIKKKKKLLSWSTYIHVWTILWFLSSQEVIWIWKENWNLLRVCVWSENAWRFFSVAKKKRVFGREREKMAEEKSEGVEKATMSPWEQHSAVINLPRFDYNAPSSLLRNSHTGFLITCTISSVTSPFSFIPFSLSFLSFSIPLSRAREERHQRSNHHPS